MKFHLRAFVRGKEDQSRSCELSAVKERSFGLPSLGSDWNLLSHSEFSGAEWVQEVRVDEALRRCPATPSRPQSTAGPHTPTSTTPRKLPNITPFSPFRLSSTAPLLFGSASPAPTPTHTGTATPTRRKSTDPFATPTGSVRTDSAVLTPKQALRIVKRARAEGSSPLATPSHTTYARRPTLSLLTPPSDFPSPPLHRVRSPDSILSPSVDSILSRSSDSILSFSSDSDAERDDDPPCPRPFSAPGPSVAVPPVPLHDSSASSAQPRRLARSVRPSLLPVSTSRQASRTPSPNALQRAGSTKQSRPTAVRPAPSAPISADAVPALARVPRGKKSEENRRGPLGGTSKIPWSQDASARVRKPVRKLFRGEAGQGSARGAENAARVARSTVRARSVGSPEGIGKAGESLSSGGRTGTVEGGRIGRI